MIFPFLFFFLKGDINKVFVQRRCKVRLPWRWRDRDDFLNRHRSLCYCKDILSLTQDARFMAARTKILPLIIHGLLSVCVGDLCEFMCTCSYMYIKRVCYSTPCLLSPPTTLPVSGVGLWLGAQGSVATETALKQTKGWNRAKGIQWHKGAT